MTSWALSRPIGVGADIAYLVPDDLVARGVIQMDELQLHGVDVGLLLHRRGEAAAEIALIHGGVIAVPSVPGVGVLIMAGKGPVRLDGDLGGPGPRAAREDKGLGQLGEQVLLGLLGLRLGLARVGLLGRVWVLSLLGGRPPALDRRSCRRCRLPGTGCSCQCLRGVPPRADAEVLTALWGG